MVDVGPHVRRLFPIQLQDGRRRTELADHDVRRGTGPDRWVAGRTASLSRRVVSPHDARIGNIEILDAELVNCDTGKTYAVGGGAMSTLQPDPEHPERMLGPALAAAGLAYAVWDDSGYGIRPIAVVAWVGVAIGALVAGLRGGWWVAARSRRASPG